MSLAIEIFSCRSDNYGYLLHDEGSGRTVSIDAPEAAPILARLDRRRWRLTDILVTHHHEDHIAGIAELVTMQGARVTGPKAEAEKIGGVHRGVEGGEAVEIGAMRFSVIATPGHTLGHVAYHETTQGHVFTGDALFSLGCGRMFEGAPGPMWEGLLALRGLPDTTQVYCGHEYTLANARFALSVDPDNAALRARAAEAEAQRAAGQFTVPAQLGTEKAANPFLRADAPELAFALGMEEAEPAAVFAALRKAKDNFR